MAVDFYIARGGTLSAGVLGNDYDPEGDTLKVVQWGSPSNGTLLESYENGSFVYEANPGFTGIEVFYYVVADDRLTSSTWGRIRIFVGTASNPFGGQTNEPDRRLRQRHLTDRRPRPRHHLDLQRRRSADIDH